MTDEQKSHDQTLREKFKTTDGLAQITLHANAIQTEKERLDFYISEAAQTYHIEESDAEQIVQDAFDRIYDKIGTFDSYTDIEYEIFEAIETIYNQKELRNRAITQYTQDNPPEYISTEDINAVQSRLKQLIDDVDRLTKTGDIDLFQALLIKEALNAHTYETHVKQNTSPTTTQIFSVGTININPSPISNAPADQVIKAFDQFTKALNNNETPDPT